MAQTDDLHDRGFRRAGVYDGAKFAIEPSWSDREAVYAWLSPRDCGRIVRVGVACGTSAMGGRYALYNRWLRGTFKPDNAREQRIRRMFLEGLPTGSEVWALQVWSKDHALALERELRSRWKETLDLDGMVRGGAFRETMALWRAEQGGLIEDGAEKKQGLLRRRSSPQPTSRSDVEAKLGEVQDWVRLAFQTLSSACGEAARVDESGPGRRFQSRTGATICRLHPKLGHLAVGFPNSRREEVARTGRLRAQREAAWINIEHESELHIAEQMIKAVAD